MGEEGSIKGARLRPEAPINHRPAVLLLLLMLLPLRGPQAGKQQRSKRAKICKTRERKALGEGCRTALEDLAILAKQLLQQQ
ncbi:hypothetical protein Emed_007591 [Eimeria media]